MSLKDLKKKKLGRPFQISGEKGTKEKIFEASIALFADQGFKGTSIRQIAYSLGMTEGAIYRHYQNKEEILNAIFSYAENLIFSPLPIEKTVEKTNNQSIFRGLLEPLPDLIIAEPYMIKIMRIMFNEMNTNEKIGHYYLNEYTKLGNQYISELFKKCIDLKRIKPCNVSALTAVFNNYRFAWAYNTFIVKKPDPLDVTQIKMELEEVILFLEESFV
jgi:AcrR family transcriptional regulator